MGENKVVFKPEYEDMSSRTEGLFIGSFIDLILLIIGTILFLVNELIWFGIVYVIAYSFILVYSFKPYVFYIEVVIIDCKENSIEFLLKKFDKEYPKIRKEINNDMSVQMRYHWFRRYPKWEIRIYNKGKCIVKQIETEGWTKEMFDNIKLQVNALKKK